LWVRVWPCGASAATSAACTAAAAGGNTAGLSTERIDEVDRVVARVAEQIAACPVADTKSRNVEIQQVRLQKTRGRRIVVTQPKPNDAKVFVERLLDEIGECGDIGMHLAIAKW
jgi:hypothetical protein